MENAQVYYSLSGAVLIIFEDNTKRLYRVKKNQDVNDFEDATNFHMGFLSEGSGPFYLYPDQNKPLEDIFHDVWIKDKAHRIHMLIQWSVDKDCGDNVEFIKKAISENPEVLSEVKVSTLRVAGLSEEAFNSIPSDQRGYVETYEQYRAGIAKETQEILDVFIGVPEIYAIYSEALEMVTK